MHELKNVGLAEVKSVYSGAEGRLWELIMGEQIHIGGLRSSQDLANRAGIAPETSGVDLCCCTGAGMRFLVRFCKVARMHGVDATEHMVELGRQRSAEEGLSDKITLTLGDACSTQLPDGQADFVWGEDAWCYVENKPALIAEAARLLKPGGTIAFTDWIEGPIAMSNAEAQRFLTFMKFPNILDLDEYSTLLQNNDCTVTYAEHTDLFPQYVGLYRNMLAMQLTYDALKIIDFDAAMMEALDNEMKFMQMLAHERKIAQGMFVAQKK